MIQYRSPEPFETDPKFWKRDATLSSDVILDLRRFLYPYECEESSRHC